MADLAEVLRAIAWDASIIVEKSLDVDHELVLRSHQRNGGAYLRLRASTKGLIHERQKTFEHLLRIKYPRSDLAHLSAMEQAKDDQMNLKSLSDALELHDEVVDRLEWWLGSYKDIDLQNLTKLEKVVSSCTSDLGRASGLFLSTSPSKRSAKIRYPRQRWSRWEESYKMEMKPLVNPSTGMWTRIKQFTGLVDCKAD